MATRRAPAVGKWRAFGGRERRSVTFAIVRMTGRQFTGSIAPGFLQRRDDLMKVFTTIAWTAVVLVLLAAYLVALTRLRMVEFRTDPRGVASGASTEFKPGHALRFRVTGSRGDAMARTRPLSEYESAL